MGPYCSSFTIPGCEASAAALYAPIFAEEPMGTPGPTVGALAEVNNAAYGTMRVRRLLHLYVSEYEQPL